MDYLPMKAIPKEAFDKAIKVINSCKNTYHTKAARKYINLFFKCYSPTPNVKSGFRVFSPPQYIADQYNTLLHNLGAIERQLD